MTQGILQMCFVDITFFRVSLRGRFHKNRQSLASGRPRKYFHFLPEKGTLRILQNPPGVLWFRLSFKHSDGLFHLLPFSSKSVVVDHLTGTLDNIGYVLECQAATRRARVRFPGREFSRTLLHAVTREYFTLWLNNMQCLDGHSRVCPNVRIEEKKKKKE